MSNEIKEFGSDFNSNTTDSSTIPASPFKLKVKTAIPLEEVPEHLRAGQKQASVAQVVAKAKVSFIDYTKLTQDDIFDLNSVIEAKPLMASNAFNVELKDKNYEPRWVSKNSQRLGFMLAKGFMYVVADDLMAVLEIAPQPDASGHFSHDDVVLMRILKSIYYPALKANHLKAVQATQNTRAAQAGRSAAMAYMSNAKDNVPGFGETPTNANIGSEFAEAAHSGQMEFYIPGQSK